MNNNKQTTLSSYAENIMGEMKFHADGIIKGREPELMKVAKFPGMGIIQARDLLQEILNELQDKNFVTYEKKGERFIITSCER